MKKNIYLLTTSADTVDCDTTEAADAAAAADASAKRLLMVVGTLSTPFASALASSSAFCLLRVLKLSSNSFNRIPSCLFPSSTLSGDIPVVSNPVARFNVPFNRS